MEKENVAQGKAQNGTTSSQIPTLYQLTGVVKGMIITENEVIRLNHIISKKKNDVKILNGTIYKQVSFNNRGRKPIKGSSWKVCQQSPNIWV